MENTIPPTKRIKYSIIFLISSTGQYNEKKYYQTDNLELYLNYINCLVTDIEKRKLLVSSFIKNNNIDTLTLPLTISESEYALLNKDKIIAYSESEVPLIDLKVLSDLDNLFIGHSQLYVLVKLYGSIDGSPDLYKMSVYSNSSVVSKVYINPINNYNYDNIHKLAIPVRLDDNHKYYQVSKSDDYVNVAYLWSLSEPDEKSIEITLGKSDLIFFTFHEYSYVGFFKPSLYEVYKWLPSEPKKQFYVTTSMISNDPNYLTIGNYHIGITRVWFKTH